MTTAEIAVLMETAGDELKGQIGQHPEIEYAVQGTGILIRVALATARTMHSEGCRRRHLGTVAEIAGRNMHAVLDRRPHLADRAELLRDVACSLITIGAEASRQG